MKIVKHQFRGGGEYLEYFAETEAEEKELDRMERKGLLEGGNWLHDESPADMPDDFVPDDD